MTIFKFDKRLLKNWHKNNKYKYISFKKCFMIILAKISILTNHKNIATELFWPILSLLRFTKKVIDKLNTIFLS